MWWSTVAALAVEVLPPASPPVDPVSTVARTPDGWVVEGDTAARGSDDGAWTPIRPPCEGGTPGRATEGGLVWDCGDFVWSARGVTIRPRPRSPGYADGWLTPDGAAVLLEEAGGAHAVIELPSGRERSSQSAGVDAPVWDQAVTVRAVGNAHAVEELHDGGIAVFDLATGAHRRLAMADRVDDWSALKVALAGDRAAIAFEAEGGDGSVVIVADLATATVVARRAIGHATGVVLRDGHVGVVEGTDLVLRDGQRLDEVGRVALHARPHAVYGGSDGSLALEFRDRDHVSTIAVHTGPGSPTWVPGRSPLQDLRGTAHGVLSHAAGLTFRVDGTPAWWTGRDAAGPVLLDGNALRWPDGRVTPAVPNGTLVDATADRAVFAITGADGRRAWRLVGADGSSASLSCQGSPRLGPAHLLCWTPEHAELYRYDGEFVLVYGPSYEGELLDVAFTPAGVVVLAWRTSAGHGRAAADGPSPDMAPLPADSGVLSRDGARAAFLHRDAGQLRVSIVDVGTGAVLHATSIDAPPGAASAAFDDAGRLYVGFGSGALHRFEVPAGR